MYFRCISKTAHTRYSPWLIGIVAAFFFFEARKQSIRIPKVIPA